jgi:hypothetical protein
MCCRQCAQRYHQRVQALTLSWCKCLATLRLKHLQLLFVAHQLTCAPGYDTVTATAWMASGPESHCTLISAPKFLGVFCTAISSKKTDTSA